MKPLSAGAMTHTKHDQLAHSKHYYKKILKRNPDDPESLHFIGRLSINQGYLNKGLRMIKRAISRAPLNPHYHVALATGLYQTGDLEIASVHSRLALRMDEKLHEPLNVLGLIARDQGKYDAAIEYLSMAMENHVPYTDAMNNLATVLIRQGDFDTAEKYLRLVIKLAPKDFRAWNNLGLVLRGKGNLLESKQSFLNAEKYPPSRFNLGHILLLEGDIKKGLSLYEQRKKLLGIGKDLHKPEWNGKPHRQKTVLVIHEQGLGDTIMMSRFFPDLFHYFQKVIVKVQKSLVTLMKTIDSRLTIITDIKGVAFDYWVPVMSLPYRMNIDDKQKIPKSTWFKIPYVKNDSKRARVGLNWAGNPSYKYDTVRSTHLKELEMLLKTKEVEWVSLHKGHLEKEADYYNIQQPLATAKDFLDTAIFLYSLDLVISTETAVPNLSAALGIPTCVLTAPDYDWRWKHWYKNVHICAQELQGNWFGSIYKALEVLDKIVKSKI